MQRKISPETGENLLRNVLTFEQAFRDGALGRTQCYEGFSGVKSDRQSIFTFIKSTIWYMQNVGRLLRTYIKAFATVTRKIN